MQLERVNYLVVHCSATPPSYDIDADTIRQWHLDKGWSDIGYHWVIRRDGTTEPGRPESEEGAHVRGWNDESLGICLVGGVNEYNDAEDNFTRFQKLALFQHLTALRQTYPYAQIVGHRDFPDVNKECPCFDVRAWWRFTNDLPLA